MHNYEITLAIKAADLATIIEARESIIVAKALDGRRPTAAWLVIPPMEAIRVQWADEYGLYASHVDSTLSWTVETPFPSQSGMCYPLTPDSAFGTASACPVPIASTDYGVVNDLPKFPSLTFGLMQRAVVNQVGQAPGAVSAEAIPRAQQGIFPPMPTAWVWLQSELARGTRLDVGQAISNPAIVTFDNGNSVQSLVYDANRGMFVPST